MSHRTRLKICCISSIDEARLAVSAGADAIGLVGSMPSGPGVIDDELIRRISDDTPPPIATFLLTSETKPDRVVSHARRSHANTVQLVDDSITTDVYSALREQCPLVNIIQVVHVVDQESVDRALAAAKHVDALLLDSGNPTAPTPELGGTGRTHDWALSREIVERAPKPTFLAGGLNPENIAEAVRATRPFGVDLCSGVRTNGKLDPDKTRRFIEALSSA